MSGSVNRVILIGNLGADPETRTLPSGGKIVSMRLACSESWRDKNSGERKERTEWVTVVLFNEGLAKIAEAYLRKGSKVYIEGSLQTRKWQDQSGAGRYSTEVVVQPFGGALTLLDARQDSAPPEAPAQAPQGRYSADKTKRQVSAPAFESGAMGDDIPF